MIIKSKEVQKVLFYGSIVGVLLLTVVLYKNKLKKKVFLEMKT
jgi:hypothetical protein